MRNQMFARNRETSDDLANNNSNGGVEFTTYTVHIPPTPDNQPSAGEITVLSPSTSLLRRVDDQYASSSLFTGGHNRVTRAQPSSVSLPEDPQTVAAEGINGGGEFDHAKWLFEGRGSYGYGNAMWPGEEEGDRKVFEEEKWRPLTRKTSISAAILFPYRLLILIRMIVLGLFLQWRILNPNEDALWLWGMSVACECWFAFSWLLDQLPKLHPVDRSPDTDALKHNFREEPSGTTTTRTRRRSLLPGIDVFVSTADPEKEPPLVTANTVLSILAADYPVESLACYLSDDGGSLLTFEALAEAASFAALWVPFCRKHAVEPRNPEAYFGARRVDPYKNKVLPDFVRDRRRVKREYDEFKVRVNALTESIRRRSDAYNTREEIRAMKIRRERARENYDSDDDVELNVKFVKATWMADGTHWPGAWTVPAQEHSRGDHASIIQVMIKPPSREPLRGTSSTEEDPNSTDMSETDTRLPMLVYVSREKRPGYDHNKKAGAMNALVRASAVMSNGPFILNLDCDHYVNNSEAVRQGMCFMLDPAEGPRIGYVQFPQRFEGIDPSDRYANHNTVFFDVNMRALDGLQGPFYVGTGCLFRRTALYGFRPSKITKTPPGRSFYSRFFVRMKPFSPEYSDEEDDEEEGLLMSAALVPKKRFGNSNMLLDAIRGGNPRGPLEVAAVAEAVGVVSCWYEDKTEWGGGVGWIYGSVTEDVVTGYHMHDRGWRSVYCSTKKRDAFRGTAPINLTDRLHQVLRWATGSVEIFFSRNNAALASSRMNPLQRVAYLNVGIYPFTSVFLLVYCFLPALSLFSGQFIVQSLSPSFLVYLLGITLTLIALAVLEIRWAGIGLEEWWRNEQFWLIGGTSAHLAAVLQGLLKVVAGIEISFTLTSKAAADDGDEEFAELYEFKWTALMVPPVAIMMTNLIAIGVAVCRTIYSERPEWSNLLGGVFFSLWVLMHLYPFAKGLMGRRGRTPTIVFVWSGLVAITISLLWVAINPPSNTDQIGGSFQFP